MLLALVVLAQLDPAAPREPLVPLFPPKEVAPQPPPAPREPDLTPDEVRALTDERSALTATVGSRGPALALLISGAVVYVAGLFDFLALGYIELTWAFNGFPRVTALENPMLIFGAATLALGAGCIAAGVVMLVQRLREASAVQDRLDAIDLQLRTRSDVDPTRI